MAYVYDDNDGTMHWVDDPQGDPYTPAPSQPSPQTPTSDGPGNQWGIAPNSGSSEDRDLWYWLNHGVTPQGNDASIFDKNGQLRPGWKRTARGYERDSDTPTPNPTGVPTTTSGPRTFNSGGGNGLRSLSSLWPDWNPPNFQGPAPFEYADFTAPTLQDAENEPGYAFAASQGRKQVEATKAAQGVYKSGQTLKDIYAWASEYAKQNYGGAFDRKLQVYGTNRNNAADNYMTNYGVSRDVFDRNYNSYLGGFDSKKRQAELEFGRDWDQYASDVDIKKTIYQGGNT